MTIQECESLRPGDRVISSACRVIPNGILFRFVRNVEALYELALDDGCVPKPWRGCPNKRFCRMDLADKFTLVVRRPK